ncbi:MAG TPA: sigma 54-interacting transcriptional regulator [Gemmataceae bacterium]|nr:sigma 54-interacting transcriptional regulator [Gemmataceae bacterium]
MATPFRAAFNLTGSALGEISALLRRPDGRRRVLIVVAGALICLYSVGVLWHVLNAPDIGLYCPLGMEIRRVADDFAPAGERGGPREGDTIVALCGQRVDWQHFLRGLGSLRDEPPQPIPPEIEGADVAATLRAAAGAPDLRLVRVDGVTWVRVDFERTSGDGSAATCWRRLGTPEVEVALPSVLWFLLKAGLFVVGAIVFWKRPEDPSASQFFVFCLGTIGAFMGGYNWLYIATQPALLIVFMVSAVLLPAASLHFYLLFPRPKEFMLRRPRRALAAIYGPPALFLAAMLICYATTRALYAPNRVTPDLVTLGWLQTIVFSYFPVAGLWFLASVVSLVLSYRRAADATERNQVKCILLGALAAMVPIGYSLYLTLFDRSAFGKGAATWPMFLASALFTVTFTISITRYRLMQLDQIISSGVGYFLISFLAGLLYYGLVFVGMVFVGSQVLSWPSPGQALWVCGTALVLLLVLDLARGRLRRALDRHFRREKHGLDRTLKQMSQAIGQLVDPPALARRLLHTSADLLGTPRGAVYLRQGSPPLYVLADSLGGPPALTELAPGCPLIEAVQARGTLAARHTRLAADDPAQRQLRFLGGAVAQPLTHEGQLQALLVLGPRAEGVYGPDDLNLLAAFAQVTVLALVSAEGHQTIDALNRELQAKVDKIAEQQRRIVALQSQLQRSLVPGPSSLAGNGDDAPAAEPETRDKGQGTRDKGQPGGILGSSPQVRQLLAQVRKVAASPSEVLIRGESGTGKELLARALHETGPRAGRPFVTVHCAALSPGLLESELFGHVKGAFTGAHRDKVGRFELANGGTLFLDEIGDIDLSVQTKLLRVLQEMTFERVGSSEPVQVQVRLIAATHQDLEELIRRGRFREDLYYRLNVISIPVPPLRERVEDVPELVQHFLRLYGGRCGKADLGIDDDALVVLKSYRWPGNVRQLENVVERAVVFAEGPAVTVADLPPELADGGKPYSPPHAGRRTPATVAEERAERDRRERERLVRALAAAGGVKAEAARALGMARSTLVSRLKKHGLS